MTGPWGRPSVTVDLVIFTVLEGELKVLLIRRGGEPCKGMLALPGGFVDAGNAGLARPPGEPEDQGEDVEAAALRELGEETALDAALLRRHQVHLEQLYTFGRTGRDPRTRVITVAYYALVPPELVPLVQAGDDAAEADWYTVATDVPWSKLAFDHADILSTGLTRIRGKLDHAPIAFALVPSIFTASELRAVHEAIRHQRIDAANFRRRLNRMLEDGLIVPVPEKRPPGGRGGRPATQYRFRAAGRDPGGDRGEGNRGGKPGSGTFC